MLIEQLLDAYGVPNVGATDERVRHASTCDVRRTTQAVTETTDRIKVGDEVEVFQATINPWTCEGEIGQRGVVTGIISEIAWRNSHCIEVDVVDIGEDNAFALCDVRKVC